MKHPFDLDDFESFLSDQSEKLRMYPEDKVWRNIQQSLHGKGRWPALTFAAFLTGAFITVLLFLTHPAKELLNTSPLIASNNIPDASALDEQQVTPVVIINPSSVKKDVLQSGLFKSPSRSSNVLTGEIQRATSLLVETKDNTDQAFETDPQLEFYKDLNQKESPGLAKIIPLYPASLGGNKFQNTEKGATTFPEFGNINATKLEKSLLKESAILSTNNQNVGTATDNPSNSEGLEKPINNILPPKAGKPGKWELQFYATPSVSYRHLIDDKRQVLDQGSGPYALFATQEVNAFVRQKPKMGLEAGAAVLYSISDNFRIKTGLQLNFRRFGISAYNTITEPARMDLDNGFGVRSMVQLTNISNQSGYREIELNNHFLQLALPVGFDLKLVEAKNIAFYIAASGQLTYQLKSNSYQISSDFKNFVKNTDLDRKVNFNSAVEAFVTFKTGNVTWQAGPQIRYQLLPGSKSSYLIREHLIDYGMKVGITKTLK